MFGKSQGGCAGVGLACAALVEAMGRAGCQRLLGDGGRATLRLQDGIRGRDVISAAGGSAVTRRA